MPARRSSFLRAAVAGAAASPGVADPGPRFAVSYGDDVYTFPAGTRMRFGRDDEACQIPVWEQINARALSKVAGELWCANGQMWVRNLSAAHELLVSGSATSRVLPARVGADAGHACSVPSPRGVVSAPSTGQWALVVSCMGGPDGCPDDVRSTDEDRTLRVEDILDRHRAAAEALCAPLLDGSSTSPATYAQIADALGWTERVARRRVEELCGFYEAQIEALPGGRVRGETLAQAVARTLVARGKFAVAGAEQEFHDERGAPP